MNRYFIVMPKYLKMVLLVFFLLPQISLALSNPLTSLEEAGRTSGLNTTLSPTQIVARTINALLGLVGSIFIILIIWSGFRWMTSAGNTDQIKKAKETMINSVIGLAIITASYIIAYSILTILVEGRLIGNDAADGGHTTP